MISEKENTRLSKFLSLVLRHKPETIGIRLDENGWVDVTILLSRVRDSGIAISREILCHVVDTNNKKRFAFNADQTKIRASQGHSIEIELAYEPARPPIILYHGTTNASLESIQKEGLQKMNRHHVHLSQEVETAVKVGQRHGKPVVLQVAAQQMFDEGYIFYLSENNVWLVNDVPIKYITTQFGE